MANNQPPGFAAAVCAAGALGTIAGAALSPDELRAEIRAMPDGAAFAVNLFAPPYLQEDALAVVLEERPAVFSFTFGIVDPAPLHEAGIEVWGTATSAEEAAALREAGVDAVVAQGAEAGGHRGSFANREDMPVYGLLPLLALIAAAVPLPLVASGGIADGAALAAVLCAGARAAQIGTAFMLAPEAGTSAAHRAALRAPGETVLTRAFTGRAARGIRNEFIAEHESHAALAYPELHHVTAAMRRIARERGDATRINLWAGQAHELAVERPAAETVHELTRAARAALRRAAERL